ncbi:MAG: hypothetical protein II039_00570, partial [Treponema sp.]|nr:hypothetical protein [Treponema sp.]
MSSRISQKVEWQSKQDFVQRISAQKSTPYKSVTFTKQNRLYNIENNRKFKGHPSPRNGEYKNEAFYFFSGSC